MLKANWHIVTGVFISVSMLVLASCSRDAGGIDVPSAGEMTLNIGFKVPTKAPEDGYEEGDAEENYVDVENGRYRICFFDMDNTLIARFEPYGFIAEDGSGYTRYNVLGKAPDELVGHDSFKIVVLANWPDFDEVDALLQSPREETAKTTIDDICNAGTYACIEDGILDPDKKKLMPFYGVHEYLDVTFTAGQATILGEPVTLLRAMAKVEVILEADSGADLSLASLKINRYNATGYCAPAGVYSEDDYDHKGNIKEDYVHSVHLVDGKNDEEQKELEFRFVNEWDEGGSHCEKWMAYVPEYRNIGAGDSYSSIKARLNIQTEEGVSHTVYFAEYVNGHTDNGSRLDIERNNIYRFHMKCTGYNFKLLLQVSDWEHLYENSFEFGEGQVVSPVSPWEDEISNDIEF